MDKASNHTLVKFIRTTAYYETTIPLQWYKMSTELSQKESSSSLLILYVRGKKPRFVTSDQIFKYPCL